MANTLQIWKNIYNLHKYLEVRTYKCGHTYVAQYMRYEADETRDGKAVVNWTGNRYNRRRRVRLNKESLANLLDDYVCEGVYLI